MTRIGLNIGLKALQTSQTGLDVMGHNVANANTPGYSRQSLALASGTPIWLRGHLMGTGVDPGVVSRTVDALLNRRIVLQTSSLSRLETSAVGYGQLEALLSEPGEFGLGQRFGAMFASISDLSVSPNDGVLRAGMVQQAAGLAGHLRGLVADLERFKSDSLAQVPFDLSDINRIAEEIARLNMRISELESSGVTANDLRDQRDVRLGELARLIDVTYQDQPNGTVRVSVGGRLLVGATRSYAMEVRSGADGGMELHLEGGSVPVRALRGAVAARLELGREIAPSIRGKLDQLARNMILEFNRAHSTGVPSKGYFQQLAGAYPLKDTNGDGNNLDELLSQAGLPFEIQKGELQVNITDVPSGKITTHRLSIDPKAATVGDFVASLSSIPGISASIDSQGHLRIVAGPGKGFDFAARLDSSPDDLGTFGGGQASLATPASGPFVLADGDTLDLLGPSGPVSIIFQSADFANIGLATATELAAVINADAGIQANDLRAVTVDGRLVLQTNGEGSQASFDVSGGTALGALGLGPMTVTGSDFSVEVEVSGSYTGSANDRYTFVPSSDGTIGTTPGLTVEVRDSAGKVITVLDVGQGYQPGEALEIAHGVSVSFGFGELSATQNDVFKLDITSDSDSADVLVAMGLNAFFVGTGAGDFAVRNDLETDPNRLASSASGNTGDNGVLLQLLELQSGGLEGLEGESVTSFYGALVSTLGFEASSANNAFEIEQFLMDGLAQRREQISGVNIEEELVNMIQFEQTYQAAARYIQVVTKLGEELLGLL